MAVNSEINQVLITGPVIYVKDPQYTDKGVPKTTLMVNTNPFSESGNVVPVVVWADIADFVIENVAVGMQVLVSGKMVVTQYMKDEKKVYFTFVQANLLKIVSDSEYVEPEEEEVKPKPKPRPEPPKQAVKSTKVWGNKPKTAPAKKKVETYDELDDEVEEDGEPI